MAARNADVPADRRMEFRMGINLGDIIRDGRDIYGDGVNVAARLEALAEPGRICVSRVVRDQVRDRLEYTFDDLGEQQVRNISRPVRAFALRPETIAQLPMEGMSITRPRRRFSIVTPIPAVVAAVLVIASIAWWIWPQTKSPSSPPTAAAATATTSIAQPFVAPRLSIVVLP